MYSIPEPWRGDRKHASSWIKIIYNHKPWVILFITLQHHFYLYITFQMPFRCKSSYLHHFNSKCVIIHCDIIAMVYEKFIPWVISTRYEGYYNLCPVSHIKTVLSLLQQQVVLRNIP